MFLIIYARIVDNKKEGLNLEGPFYGPECNNMQETHEACRKLVSPSKDHVLIKILDLEEMDYHQARVIAKTQFDRTFNQMESAYGFCDAPRRRKK